MRVLRASVRLFKNHKIYAVFHSYPDSIDAKEANTFLHTWKATLLCSFRFWLHLHCNTLKAKIDLQNMYDCLQKKRDHHMVLSRTIQAIHIQGVMPMSLMKVITSNKSTLDPYATSMKNPSITGPSCNTGIQWYSFTWVFCTWRKPSQWLIF